LYVHIHGCINENALVAQCFYVEKFLNRKVLSFKLLKNFHQRLCANSFGIRYRESGKSKSALNTDNRILRIKEENLGI